jgi:aryl-alcohol dehydrogenase-like predicted oxidoreductase
MMNYRSLGKTGVKVSSLCFGTMSFGKEADEQTSAAMFQRCREVGINFFDCANSYSNGRAEEILGRLIAACRDEVILTSKVFATTGPDAKARGASRRNIMAEVEKSLKRLGTDHIDVYFIHHFDADTPLDESLRALDDLVRAGKILYPAASNFAAWQVEKSLGMCRLNGWAPFEVIEPMYNLVKRQVEVEILPMAVNEGLGVITYSPLAGGLLSGKYSREKRPETGRLVEDMNYQKRYDAGWIYETAEKFSEFAVTRGYNPVALAVAWVGSHPAVTAPIIGARSLEQLEGSLGSIKIEMTTELRTEIGALSRTPPSANDR